MLSDFSLIRKMLNLSNQIINLRTENLSKLELTAVQSEALQYIERNNGCCISDLRSYLNISHQAACKIVDRMKTKGLLCVSVSENDARTKKIELSEKGHIVYAAIIADGTSVGGILFSELSNEEKAQLNIILEKMLAAL